MEDLDYIRGDTKGWSTNLCQVPPDTAWTSCAYLMPNEVLLKPMWTIRSRYLKSTCMLMHAQELSRAFEMLHPLPILISWLGWGIRAFLDFLHNDYKSSYHDTESVHHLRTSYRHDAPAQKEKEQPHQFTSKKFIHSRPSRMWVFHDPYRGIRNAQLGISSAHRVNSLILLCTHILDDSSSKMKRIKKLLTCHPDRIKRIYVCATWNRLRYRAISSHPAASYTSFLSPKMKEVRMSDYCLEKFPHTL